MINQIQSPRTQQSYFVEYIKYTLAALRQPRATLEKMFSDRDFRVIYCKREDYSEKYMEIRFDTATIKRLLRDNDICEGSFLFFDDVADLESFIEYCTRAFAYDNRLRKWGLKDGCIYVVRNGDDSFLAFLTN